MKKKKGPNFLQEIHRIDSATVLYLLFYKLSKTAGLLSLKNIDPRDMVTWLAVMSSHGRRKAQPRLGTCLPQQVRQKLLPKAAQECWMWSRRQCLHRQRLPFPSSTENPSANFHSGILKMPITRTPLLDWLWVINTCNLLALRSSCQMSVQ